MCPTFQSQSASDCEIILHMYNKYGIRQTLQFIDGVFAFVLIDHKKNSVYVARDTYGVRPLFFSMGSEQTPNKNITFSSDIKCISKLLSTNMIPNNIKQFPSGVCYKYSIDNVSGTEEYWYRNCYSFSSPNAFQITYAKFNWEEQIYAALDNAVKKTIKN